MTTLTVKRRKHNYRAHLEWTRNDEPYQRRAVLHCIDANQVALGPAHDNSDFTDVELFQAPTEARKRGVKCREKVRVGRHVVPVTVRRFKNIPRQMINQHSAVEERLRFEGSMQESGSEVLTDESLCQKAVQIFFERAKCCRVVLRVVDMSEIHGTLFMADFSGKTIVHVIMCRVRFLP